MNCGDVIFREDKPYVITEMENGRIVEVEKLEDFVAKSVVVEHGGQRRTLFGLLHEYMADYLYHMKIVEEKK